MKNIQLTKYVASIFLMFFLALSTEAAKNQSAGTFSNQPVKMSKSGICHSPGSSYYSRTKNYTPYKSMEDCLKAGGRRPKR